MTSTATMDANTVIKDWPEDARTVTAAHIPLVTTDQLKQAAKEHKATIPVG